MLTPEYIATFVADDPARWSPQERVIPDAELVAGLARDHQVVAIVGVNVGIHPRWVVTFVEHGGEMRLVATFAQWGQVQEKRVGRMPLLDARGWLDTWAAEMDCEPGIGLPMRGLVVELSAQPKACQVGALSEEGPLRRGGA